MLLLIAYFVTFTHCQGGGGSEGADGGGGFGGGGYYGGSGTSCTTDDCQRRSGIILGSVLGGIIGCSFTMHLVYRVLLFLAYFVILIQCQGGGGGGGGGGSGGGGGRGENRGSGASCTTDDCRRRAGIIVGSILGGIIGLSLLVVAIVLGFKYCKGRPLRKNSTFVKVAKSKNFKQEAYDINHFQSGIWSNRYFQYGNWHGPYQLSLSFDPQSMIITGSGSDDVGTFTIHGTYSIETYRMGFTKIYQQGTGNSSENLGHQVTIQLTWNAQNNQFEGKWYVQTSKYHGEDKFELKFDGQHIQTVYEKV
ncbi:unnamed protein product [Rotaria sp. Silwood1]|nr:unnamed protein product [Rotaria sp. Silwood1]